MQILKFSDPYDFYGLAFWSPLPKEVTEKCVCGPAFGASLFKLWDLTLFILELRFWGPWTLWGPALFWSRVETGNKKPFWARSLGSRFLNFWGLRFLRTLGSLGPRAETGNKENRLRPRFLGPRDLGSLGFRTSALFGLRDETGKKNSGQK